MRNLSLFPLEDDELSPQADRIEPTFWLRRLVLLPKFDGDAEPTRDIEFRRGLNIVQTSPRQDSDTEVVGHSVGKTLLTRLIRYTLGEPSYATQAEKTKILGHRPDGCVIAHWRIDHVDWCVVRPFQPDRRNAPFAIRSDNWRSVFDPTCDRVSFDGFTECLREATCGALLELPNRALDHSMWLKVVAFLTRDWQCGYRRFNDWRHSDSESDVTVDRNEASRLCRWLMNLIEIEELPLWSKHNSLRNDLARTTTERQRHNLVLQTVDPELQRRLEFSDSDESPVGLFAGRLTDAVSHKLEQLMALLNDCVERSELQALETQHNQIDEQLERQIADHSKAESKLNHLTDELQTRLKANDAEAYSRTSSYENCRLAECPMKLVNRPAPLPEPGFEEITETLREEIEDCRRDVMRMTHSCDQLRAQRKEVRKVDFVQNDNELIKRPPRSNARLVAGMLTAKMLNVGSRLPKK